jgi:hypothetical protein
MKPIILLISTCLGVWAQIPYPSLPNSNGANFRANLNADIAWLNANKVGTGDSRLTDARTPLAHVHLISDITGLQGALDAKQATLSVYSTISSLTGYPSAFVPINSGDWAGTWQTHAPSYFVPYTGANNDVNLGTHNLTAHTITSTGSGPALLGNPIATPTPDSTGTQWYVKTGGAWCQQTPGAVETCIGSGGGGSPGVCSLASSLGFALNGTDETTLLNSAFAAWYSAGTGGCLAIDAGKTLRADGQITLPSGAAGSTGNAYWPGAQPPYRITGAQGNYLTMTTGPTATPVGGSTLDLRYKSSGLSAYQGGPKLLSVGQGVFELDHINITTKGASDCATFVMVTGSTPYFHDLQLNGTGCNGGIVLGGTGPISTYPANTPLSSAVTGWFGGYGGYLQNVSLYGFGNATAPAVLLGTSVNGFRLQNIWVSYGGSSTAYLLNGGQAVSASHGPAIYSYGYSTGTSANRHVIMDGILVEGIENYTFGQAYTCAIKLHNTEDAVITNSSYWDANGGNLLCGDSTAVKNRVLQTNYNDVVGSGFTDSGWAANNDMPYKSIPFTFDGAGSVPTAATACSPELTFGGIVNRFSMYGDVSGNATVVVSAGSSPASQTTISSTETMTGATSLIDTALSGWTYTGTSWLPAGSVVCVTLSSPATLHRLVGSIRVLEGR